MSEDGECQFRLGPCDIQVFLYVLFFWHFAGLLQKRGLRGTQRPPSVPTIGERIATAASPVVRLMVPPIRDRPGWLADISADSNANSMSVSVVNFRFATPSGPISGTSGVVLMATCFVELLILTSRV